MSPERAPGFIINQNNKSVFFSTMSILVYSERLPMLQISQLVVRGVPDFSVTKWF